MGNKSKTDKIKKKAMKNQGLGITKVQELKSKDIFNEETFKARKNAIIKLIEWYKALKEEQSICFVTPKECEEENNKQLVICNNALETIEKIENEETLILVESYVQSTFANEALLNIHSYAFAFAISCQEQTNILQADANYTHSKAAEFIKQKASEEGGE